MRKPLPISSGNACLKCKSIEFNIYYVFSWGKRTFLRKKFSSPTPPSFKNLECGVIFLFYILADGCCREICYKFRDTMPDFWLSALPTFLPPTPPNSQKLLNGVIFCCPYLLTDTVGKFVTNLGEQCPFFKVFARLFQKAALSRARSPCRPSQWAKFPLSFPKRRRG